ncbi:hypothetical protein N7470_006715 [Penicillium chermesinum]|nr:hypothetical protein N7470_006715 [Penicillium chermesinum]
MTTTPPEVQPAGSTEFKSQNQSMGDEAVESDTDEDYAPDLKDGGGYYNPRKPTACSPSCPGYHANAEA